MDAAVSGFGGIVSKAAVPPLRQRGGGRNINLGSIMSNSGGPNRPADGAARHAVDGGAGVNF